MTAASFLRKMAGGNGKQLINLPTESFYQLLLRLMPQGPAVPWLCSISTPHFLFSSIAFGDAAAGRNRSSMISLPVNERATDSFRKRIIKCLSESWKKPKNNVDHMAGRYLQYSTCDHKRNEAIKTREKRKKKVKTTLKYTG